MDLSVDHQTSPKTEELVKPKDLIRMKIIEFQDEVPQAPSTVDILKTALSSKILLVALPYLCSFGSELAVE
ncbi:unnamed protein product, partial [Rotaria sordida]